MAQLLVKAEDSPTLSEHPEGAWRRGDVVGVFSDKHTFGREECPPKFAIVQMPGVSVEECQHLMEHEADEESRAEVKPMLQRRKVQFDFDKLSTQEKADTADETKGGKIKVEDRNLSHFEKDVTIKRSR